MIRLALAAACAFVTANLSAAEDFFMTIQKTSGNRIAFESSANSDTLAIPSAETRNDPAYAGALITKQ